MLIPNQLINCVERRPQRVGYLLILSMASFGSFLFMKVRLKQFSTRSKISNGKQKKTIQSSEGGDQGENHSRKCELQIWPYNIFVHHSAIYTYKKV